MKYPYEIVTNSNLLPARFTATWNPVAEYYPPHWHTDIELIFLLEGSLFITINGTVITLTPDSFILIGSNRIHSIQSGEATSGYMLQLSLNFVKENCPDCSHIAFDTCIGETFSADGRMAVRKILDNLCTSSSPDETYLHLLQKSLLYQLLYVIMKDFQSEDSAPCPILDEKNSERLISIVDYLNSHFQEALSLSAVSELFGLSPAYLSRFFKKYIGMTYTAYLDMLRLNLAHHLILYTDFSVQQIFEASGFCNYPVFVRKFREKYGKPPLQLRK